jgi:DNA polymerase I-like protein with 3'-5' exonuclease and polymerase domains/uracil-DNA glycosylase
LTDVDIPQSYVRYGNIVNCVPWEDNDRRDKVRPPSKSDIEACRIYIENDILEYKPVYVVTLGNIALHTFVPGAPGIMSARGSRYTCQVPAKEIVEHKMVLYLTDLGLDTTGLTYQELKKLCIQHGYEPRTHEFCVIPLLHPAAILRAGDKRLTLERQFRSDIEYLKSLIMVDDSSAANYRVLTTVEEIKAHCDMLIDLYNQGEIETVVCDIESNMLDSFAEGAELLLLCLCHAPGQSAVVLYNHPESPFHNDILSLSAISNILNDLFRVIPITNHNVKFDIHWLRRIGVEVRRVHNCTYLSAWTLFNNNMDHDLESLATKFTPLKQHKGELQRALDQLKGLVFDDEGKPREPNYGDVELDLLARYCNQDGDATFRLNEVFTKMLHEQNLYEPHHRYSIVPIMPAVAMEQAGVRFNTDLNSVIRDEYNKKINDYYCKLYELEILQEAQRLIEKERDERYQQKLIEAQRTGSKPPNKGKTSTIAINYNGQTVKVPTLGSTQVKRKILFDVLGCTPVSKDSKGKEDTGDPSTDKEVINNLIAECLEHSNKGKWADAYRTRLEVLTLLRDFNIDNTIYTRYLKKLPSYVHKDGLMHTSLNIGTTDTHRWSCSDPSLHIIPKESMVKDAFVPLHDSGLLFFSDYCLADGTLIDTPNGHVPIEQLNPGDFVFTYNHETRRPDVSYVTKTVNAGVAPVLKITLDNGESVVCTKDHKWLVCPSTQQDDPVEVEAQALEVGFRLLPMKRVTAMGYTHLYAHNATKYVKEHIVVARAALGGRPLNSVVHHKNEVKTDNSIGNLEYMDAYEHASKHGSVAATDQYYNDPTKKEKILEGLRRFHQERGFRGSNNPRYGDRRQRRYGNCLNCNKEIEYYASYSNSDGVKKYCSMSCYYEAKRKGLNHKVVSIEDYGVTNVRSITVERDHNYALAAGVFTCNCQNELKVLSIIANDALMKKIFHEGGDIHAAVAAQIGRSRKEAKNTNFGIAYGEQEDGLARRLAIAKSDAKAIIDDWFGKFTGVHAWIKKQYKLADTTTDIWSITGFRRTIPSGSMGRNAKRRRQINTQIQGPASDLGALALSIIHYELGALGFQSKMFAFIHDAIGYSVYPGELYKLALLTKTVMERDVLDFLPWVDVPLEADLSVGVTWKRQVDLTILPEKKLRLSGNPEWVVNVYDTMVRWDSVLAIVGSTEETDKDGNPKLTLEVQFE